MNKLECRPDRASYTVSDAANRIRSETTFSLAGVFRRNLLNDARLVDVTWQASRRMYNILAQAHRAFVKSGGDPFLMDLILDGDDLEEREVKFIGGTFGLTQVQGQTYYVKAQLEVKPAPYDVVNKNWVTDAGLQRLIFSVGTGSFAVVGKAATFKQTVTHLNTLPGAFVVNPQPVTLNKFAAIEGLLHGEFVLDPQDVQLNKVEPALKAGKGTFTVVFGSSPEASGLRSDGGLELRSDGGRELRSGT